MMIEKRITDLKPHPMNEYLFDDIEGEKWEEFLMSVQRHGVMTPLVITEDGTIISGHQRLRACQALNIPTVRCRVVSLYKDDDILLALIESNIRQRGVINSPQVKLGRMMLELERILGADKRNAGGHVAQGSVSRKEIREHLGISEKVANCSKAIAQMPAEAQEAIESGSISARTAYACMSKLTPEEQVELVKKLDPVIQYTQAEVKAAIERFFPKAKEIDEMQAKLAEYQQNDGELELREKLREAQEKERQTYEQYQSEKRARRQERVEFEKRMDAMEKLLDEQGGDAEEIARLTEERDQYMHDADTAQADADIELVCSMISAMSGAFAEVANDPRPLAGQRAGTALLLISQLSDKLDQIRERLKAGDEEIRAFDDGESS